MTDPALILQQALAAAIASALPSQVMPPHLPPRPQGRLIVIGAGKAAAAMAQVVETHYGAPVQGVVVTRYGYSKPCEHIRVLEAAHPVPDQAGMAAARHILEAVSDLNADDLVLCLISGGGSALMPLPAKGVTLQDKQSISRDLLRSGASISEINTVRRHLSAIKGGHLAAACFPAPVLTLSISDVPGDNPVDIASGPTVADPSTCAEAIHILRRYDIAIPPTIRQLLDTAVTETLKPGDPRLAKASHVCIARPQQALEQAARRCRDAGYQPFILGDALEGDARSLGQVLGAMAQHVATCEQPFRAPCVLLSGGETTVTVRGAGCGGRNVEFLLSLALQLRGHPRIWAIAADTDGVDGQADVAGAQIGPDTLMRASHAGLSPRAMLDDNDAHSFFARLNDQIITGPTFTNVNDFRALLIQAAD
jgi:hydroxypyruvate reductase